MRMSQSRVTVEVDIAQILGEKFIYLTFSSECFWFRFEEERSLSNLILLRQISKRVR